MAYKTGNKQTGQSALQQLSEMTKIVVDTGNPAEVQRYRKFAEDGTTNPSLLLEAASMEQYQHLFGEGIGYAQAHAQRHRGTTDEKVVQLAMDRIAVNFGVEILKHVRKRVSTEVDARFAYDAEEMINHSNRLADQYIEQDVDPSEQVYIKIPATWQGVQAARMLEAEGTRTNVTLIFHPIQAIAAAQYNASLLSPFVGRVSQAHGQVYDADYDSALDQGVMLVSDIFHLVKGNYPGTQVMGASFRSPKQPLALAGIDKLTISPTILDKLARSEEFVPKSLWTPEKSEERVKIITENDFYNAVQGDEITRDLLADGVTKFATATNDLERKVRKELGFAA